MKSGRRRISGWGAYRFRIPPRPQMLLLPHSQSLSPVVRLECKRSGSILRVGRYILLNPTLHSGVFLIKIKEFSLGFAGNSTFRGA